MNTLDLHVSTIARMSGGALFANRPPIIADYGMVSARVLSDGLHAFNLSQGFYIVTFQEDLLPELRTRNVWWNIKQIDLMRMGAYLQLETEPYMGFLTVGYPIQIEKGSKIVALEWKVLD